MEKKRGRGRPTTWTVEQIEAVRGRWKNGETLAKIGEEFGVSRQWIHSLLKAENPAKVNKRYKCKVCDKGFRSQSRYAPSVCPHCGSAAWQ